MPTTILSRFRLFNPLAFDGVSKVHTFDDLLAFPPPEWLIDNIVPRGAVAGLTGGPGIGKSTLAIDWACCVASGTPWHGIGVQQGYVLYLAAEGYSSLQARAISWLEANNVDRHRFRSSFGLVKDKIEMTPESMAHDTLFARIETEMVPYQEPPALVIVDTLARCIKGDENSNEAMDNFMSEVERWTATYGSTVLVIHHPNAQGSRERGHSSFRGSVNALLFLERCKGQKRDNPDAIYQLRCEKQRDAREFDPIGLKRVDVGESFLYMPADIPSSSSTPSAPKEPSRSSMLQTLRVAEDGYTWKEWKLASGMSSKNAFNSRLRKLTNDGEIYKDTEKGRYYAYPTNEDLVTDDEDDE